MCKLERMPTSGRYEEELLPYKNIAEPAKNDVLSGRGGGTNHHPGNKIYRKMVEEAKVEYLGCSRLEKPLVALRIVKKIRQAKGRFLKFDKKTGLWNDVGDKKAREKTSQALREQAPEIRKTMDPESGPQKKPWDDIFDESGEQVPEEDGALHGSLHRHADNAAASSDDEYNDFAYPDMVGVGDYPSATFDRLLEPSSGATPPPEPSQWSHRDHSLALNPLPHASTLLSVAKETWGQDPVVRKEKTKRMTSHQNETPETRRGMFHADEGMSSVKRASLDLEDRMSSLDLDSLGAELSFPPPGQKQERFTSDDLLQLVGPSEEV